MEPRYKYPRTPHLPSSPGFSSDDVFSAEDLSGPVVVTEKMDGECTTLYRDGLHARSIDSKSHPSRDWIKEFHSSFAHEIPHNMRICGENLYAKHSISYNNLSSYFVVFSIWAEDVCLSWNHTVEWCELLNLKTVPVLYLGEAQNERVYYENWYYSTFPRPSEGFVVRNTNEFLMSDFSINIAKWVRKNHVQTDKHWMSKAVVPNQIKV